MTKVIFVPEVRQFFKKLIPILYEKGYFSDREGSRKYVKELLNDIKTKLPDKLRRPAPKHFTDLYGEGLYYAVFQKNRRTHWYAFFRMYQKKGKIYYQVRHIENNHSAAHYFDFRNFGFQGN